MPIAKGFLITMCRLAAFGGKFAVRCALCLLDFVFPKDNRLIVFASAGGVVWYGNSRTLYQYLLRIPSGLEPYYYLWRRPLGPKDERCISGLHWRTAWIMLRARTVVSTHGVSDFFPYMPSGRKLVVQTWHGLPFKALHYAEPNPSLPDRTYGAWVMRRNDVFLAPSPLAARLFGRCFKLDPRKSFLCGQPRNDVLLAPATGRQRLGEFFGRAQQFDKIVLYCPTFRRFAATRLFPFDDFDGGRLDEFLTACNAAILIRTHIDENCGPEAFCSDRVFDFGFDLCPDVNDILGDVDVLVTDYSSIFLDFLLTDRPIVFLPYDLAEYKRRRGLMFDDYNSWTPGAKAGSFDEFLAALGDAFRRSQQYSPARRAINALMNKHQDGRSCERIVEMIIKRTSIW